MSTATVSSAVAPRDCKAPTLAMAGDAQSLKSEQLKEAQANFETAYQKSCTDKLLAAKPLVDPKAADQEHIFLVNAPEANVASIYLSEVDGSRMVLEYPFLTTDGKSQVPSADELANARGETGAISLLAQRQWQPRALPLRSPPPGGR